MNMLDFWLGFSVGGMVGGVAALILAGLYIGSRLSAGMGRWK